MSIGFYLFLFAVLVVRAIFLYSSRHRSIGYYTITSLAEIGLLFLFYAMTPELAAMLSALLLLLSLLQWVAETRIIDTPDSVSGDAEMRIRFVGFVITALALAIVFSSSRVLAMREFIVPAVRVVGRNTLLAASVGLVVAFELKHLVGGSLTSASRFLVYVFWIFGALLPASIVIASSMMLSVFSLPAHENRVEEARRQLISLSLAVLFGMLCRRLLGLSAV